MDEMIAVFGGKERVPSFIGGCKRTLKQCPPWNLTHMDDDAFISVGCRCYLSQAGEPRATHCFMERGTSERRAHLKLRWTRRW